MKRKSKVVVIFARVLSTRTSFLLSLALCLATAVCVPSWAGEPRSTVADLRYGVALYEYYRGKHFEALSELMVAEARGGIRGHGDNPELIKGGISLSFGMEQQAGELFNELLAADTNGEFARPLPVRNAAWFYLARLRYLRGDWEGAADSLQRVGGDFDPGLLAQLEATAINLAIRRQDLASAARQLENVRHAQDQLHYLYYNLANAYSRAGNYARANIYYQRLAELPISELPARREEQLALYDKAMTAAGYSQLLQGRHQQAIERFTQVRLDSPFSNRALLGYGWAAAEKQNYRLAIKPWQALSDRPLVHAAVQEAKIALPYAYERLGATGEALQAYLDAENTFTTEIARIDQVIGEIDQLDIFSALNIRDTRNWPLVEKNSFDKESLPENSLAEKSPVENSLEQSLDESALDENNGAQPHLRYLNTLFSLNQFQTAVQELRDLLHLAGRLEGWREKLDTYHTLLQEREGHREIQRQAITRQNLQASLEQMLATRDQLRQKLEGITQKKDYFALINDEEKTVLRAIQSAEKNIVLLKQAGEATEQYETLLKRYKGMLFWQASETYSERQWEVRRGIRQLDRAILAARDSLARLQQIMVTARDIAPYRARLGVLDGRLNARSEQLNTAIDRAEDALRGKVIQVLIEQRKRLQHYLAQTRLSVARLYDEAALEGQP
jgi:hypothetical protein